MCFSVTASFTASLALITCGVAALKYAQEKRLRMIAAAPLIFGLQQFSEGIVWASFLYPSMMSLRMPAAYIFFICAGMIWPLWVPISIMRFESAQRHRLYLPSLIAGALHALAFLFCLVKYQLIVTLDQHLIYNFAGFATPHVWGSYINGAFAILYILATIVPFFIARNRILWFIGALIAGAYIVSYVAYFEAFTSVWCFFAAIISLIVYWFVRDQARN